MKEGGEGKPSTQLISNLQTRLIVQSVTSRGSLMKKPEECRILLGLSISNQT